MKKMFTLLAFASCAFAAKAQSTLTPGNIVMYVVGNGVDTLSSSAYPVSLVERKVSLQELLLGKAPIVQTIAVPSVLGNTTGNNTVLTAQGTGTYEGQINLSSNGKYLVFGGYGLDLTSGVNTGLNKISITSTKSGAAQSNGLPAIPRVIGTLDANGDINTTTACSNLYSGFAIRSVVAPLDSVFFINGSTTGIQRAILGSNTSSSLSSYSATNKMQAPKIDALEIIDGQLYASAKDYIGSPANIAVRIATVGKVNDTTKNETLSLLSGIDTTFPSSSTNKSYPWQFVIFNVTGGKVMYIADNTTNTTVVERGIQKYSLVNGTWVFNGQIHADGIIDLTGKNIGNNVLLFGTNAKKLFGTLDNTGFNLPPADTLARVLDTAIKNYAFRGVAFAPGTTTITGLPVSLKSSLTASIVNGKAMLTWATASEIATKGFTIEKSNDGEHFNVVGNISANNKASNYTFTDASVGTIQYYRLKIENKDGSYSYSLIVALNNKLAINLIVYPNPISSTATIAHSQATAGSTIKISSIDGKTIAVYTVQTGATQTSVDASRLAKGSYIVSFENNGSKATALLVK